MISISVKNVVAFLQLVNGFSHEKVQIALPAKKEAFELFSRPSEGLDLAYLGFNLHIPENAAGLTKQQILDRLNEIKAKQK